MGTKTKWFDAFKKVFSPRSEEKKPKEKTKKKWPFSRSRSMEPIIPISNQPPPTNSEPNHTTASTSFSSLATASHSLIPQLEELKEVKLSENDNNGQNKHAYSVALASAVAAEAAAVAAQAAAEVVRLTAATNASASASAGASRVVRKSKEDVAAIKIQTFFRGFLARRALRALRGLVRLKTLVDGSIVKRQTEKTIQSIQAETRLQFEIYARRRKMVEENQAMQKQLQMKQKEERSKLTDDWNQSVQTKEQIEAGIQTRQEAAIKRERALAYAFTHQWRNTSSARILKPTFTDPTNPQWGWSWADRWMAARPWECRAAATATATAAATTTTPSTTTDHAAVKSAVQSLKPNPNPNQTLTRPSTPTSKPSVPLKVRSASPRPNNRGHNREEDVRSVGSTRSERARRHSIAGSMMGDDASFTSLTSLPVIPSYLQSTESSRAKSRAVYSPISESAGTGTGTDSNKGVKKRLSYPVTERTRLRSPGKGRRMSGPGRLDFGPLGDGS